MVEVPDALFAVEVAYIALTAALLAGAALLASPTLVIARRRAAYFDDWNDALHAPWLFWHIGGALFRLQELMGNYVMPAPQRVCDIASSYLRSQVVVVVSELGIPDLLRANGPMTAAQLAAATGAHRPYLERVLRFAGRMQLVSVAHPRPPPGKGAASGGDSSGGKGAGPRPGRFDLEGAVYGLTRLSAVLCEGHPNSVAGMVALFGDHYAAAGELLAGVRRGAVPYELHAGGRSHWKHMEEVPELRARFDRAMTQFNSLSPVEAVFMAYPSLGSASRVVDVGGGLGAFLGAALARWPGLKGALFDLPGVVGAAERQWKEGKPALAGRATFHRGSFFSAGDVPRALGGGDVYVLREILHDWSDADCVRILREVRSAIGRKPGCTLVIVEAVISEALAATASARIAGDLHMLSQYGDARERTEAEFAQLLGAAGFEMRRVVPTKGLFMVVEAAPV